MELIELEDFENDLKALDKLLDTAKSGAEDSESVFDQFKSILSKTSVSSIENFEDCKIQELSCELNLSNG